MVLFCIRAMEVAVVRLSLFQKEALPPRLPHLLRPYPTLLILMIYIVILK